MGVVFSFFALTASALESGCDRDDGVIWLSILSALRIRTFVGSINCYVAINQMED